MSINRIIGRFYASFDVKLVSPLGIGSGEDINTDMDIIRDCDGVPFIPASSISGVIRHWIRKSLGKKKENILFGSIDSKDEAMGRMSKITFYDSSLSFDESNDYCPVVSVRDMVKLDLNKSAENKFDAEIIEAGHVFNLRFEMTGREKDNIDFLEYSSMIMAGIDAGKILLGRKTRRGFGKLKIIKETLAYRKYSFDTKEDIRNWIDFKWDELSSTNEDKKIIFDRVDDIKAELDKNQNDITIKADLNIKYSTMIRSYLRSIEFDENTDYEHLKGFNEDGKLLPVIPGTSWAGAFRHHCSKLFLESNWIDYEDIMGKGFGSIDNAQKSVSCIMFSESHIENSKEDFLTRVKIDRFTGGAAESALFTEIPSYGGKTNLTITINKWDNKEHRDAFAGLVLLVLRDLYNGILAVGGKTSIGRGIMNENDKDFEAIEILGIDGAGSMDKYSKLIKSFADYIKKGGR